MNSIPLVRARYACNFVSALHQKGAASAEHLVRAQLPEDIMEQTNSVISGYSLWAFADDCALRTGLLDIGFWAGSAAIKGHGEFGSQIINAPTLHSAILTFCSEAHAEYSEADFYLTHDGSNAWFCRGPIDGTPNQRQQVELYVMMLMLQTIQLVLGGEWRPNRIRLQSTKESNIADNEFLQGLNIEFGDSITAISIPFLSLAMPLKSAKGGSGIPVPSDIFLSSNPLSAIRQLLINNIQQVNFPRISHLSDITGVSTRTFQRFLLQKGTTFTRMIDEIRFEMATPLLNDEKTPITEIAFELGYADVAHFSRAFRRITGMSPRAYRHISKTQ